MGAAWTYLCSCRETPAQEPQPEVLIPTTNEPLAKTAMTTRCRLALRKSHENLIRDLDVKRTVDHLWARMVLTPEDKQRIEGMATDYDKRRALLDLLPERSQGAYDGLCDSLSTDQPWLKNTLDNYFENITEGELEEVEGHRDLQTAELQDILKHNMQDRLEEWKTALEEGVSDREGLLPYIKQPCAFKTKASEQQSVLNTIELIENSRPGDRITVYGEAGMGKTTLLKELARSWIEGCDSKLTDKFTYVFLIPMRLVGKISLLNTICDELELIPVSNLRNLKEALDRNERKTLFLLDSFEELRRDVVERKKSDIDDLIKGKLFPKSTVVVTSRPGSRLKQSKEQTTAQLQDLPEDEVKTIIEHHFRENKEAVYKVQKSFPAMSYLQKPINLALFLFIITQNTHLTLSYTQAELFSLVLQYIMLALAKKKKLEEFIPQPGSYLANKDIPKDIRRQFSVIAKKCYQEVKNKNVILHIEDADDLKEYLDFGLFTAGTDTNTVLLPHRLFIEYFAAAYIAENPDMWAALFDEIKENSESKSPRPLLADVVRPMGLENVLRFVTALSPQPQLEQVCTQVGGLFVVEREEIDDCDNYQLANFEYYTELIRDCGDVSGKRVLATAIVNAPVREGTVTFTLKEIGSHTLLPHLEYEQCVTFVKKVHHLSLFVKEGKSTLSCAGDNKRLGIRETDSFVVALVSQYACNIKTDELDIRGKYDRRLGLPASLLTRMSGVRQISLEDCTLCEGLPDFLSDISLDMSATTEQLPPCPTNSSLERVELNGVKGLEHCDVITSRQCQLEMTLCDDVQVSALKTCFPRVSELKLYRGNRVVYQTKEELTTWLPTVGLQAVRELKLAPQLEGESLSLCRLLNILATQTGQLNILSLAECTLLLDVRDRPRSTSDTLKLSELVLEDCKGDLDLGQFLEVCNHQIQQLEEVTVRECQLTLQVNIRDARSDTVKQNNTLSELVLEDCKGDLDLGQFLEVCNSQSPQLEKVTVKGCKLQVIVRDASDTVNQNNTLSKLTLDHCAGDVDLGQLLEVCSCQNPQLENVTMVGCQLLVNLRDTSDTVKQNNTLVYLYLGYCTYEGYVDLGQLFEICRRQCPQLIEVCVRHSDLVFDGKRVRQLPGLHKAGCTILRISGEANIIPVIKMHKRSVLHLLIPCFIENINVKYRLKFQSNRSICSRDMSRERSKK